MSDNMGMLTTQQFARKADVSTSTVSKWLRSGKIEGRKINGKWMIPADQLTTTLSPRQDTDRAASVSEKKKENAADPAVAQDGYSVEEFSALTYLTTVGVERFLTSGRLTGTRDASGRWRVDSQNLDMPHVRHLRRR